MHSWGSLFIQDCLVPLQKQPFGPLRHLWILRWSIVGVAIFSFLFGTFFHLSDYISMWFTLTTAVFTGGAGSAIIGGLYWKKGTSTGAWAAFITGSTLSLTGIIFQQVYAHHGLKFPLNGTQIAFGSSVTAISVYVISSLVTYREDFNLERMLHRGVYAPATAVESPRANPGKVGWGRLIGLDENFNLGDKCIAWALFGWGLFWFAVFVVGSIWNLLSPWPDESWSKYYHVVGFGLPIFFAVVTAIWFTWGGIKDMRDLFRRLQLERVNVRDDGTVVNHQNLDEVS
jgi:SSS family solute:Na+ symporter